MEYYENEYGRRPELEPGETILWQGKPKRRAYYVHILSAGWVVLAWAAIWYVVMALSGGMGIFPLTWEHVYGVFFDQYVAPVFMISIIAFLPLLVWLVSVLMLEPIWRKTYYYVTNYRIIYRQGLAKTSIPYDVITLVNVRQTLADRLFQTESVQIHSAYLRYGRHVNDIRQLANLENAERAYEAIQGAMEKAKQED